MMQITQAERNKIPIKIGISGSSGSGKSYSSLLIAYGLTNDWQKIAVIDTENRAAHLYAHLGSNKVLNLVPPFTPERFIEAIDTCLQVGVEVIIIDSITSEWEYIVDAHSQLQGNSYTNWSKFTPRHQRFIQAILQADCHIICTIRAKQEYVLVEKNGRQIPQKMSMKPIQRDGIDYEFTILFEMDTKHNAVASKDRTSLFDGAAEFQITPLTGQQISQWCNSAVSGQSPLTVPKKPLYCLDTLIDECADVNELRELYYSVSVSEQKEFREHFDRRKEELSHPKIKQTIFNQFNHNTTNGNTSFNGSAWVR